MRKLVIVGALARNGVMGNKGDLPWGRSLPADLKRFKTITTHCGIVIMGRKTADSLPRPLLGRRNLVLSRTQLKGRPGFEFYPNLRAALRQTPATKPIAIIGGADLYRECAPYARTAYLTLIDEEFEGDVLFPVDAFAAYQRSDHKTIEPDERNAHRMHFVTARNTTPEPLE